MIADPQPVRRTNEIEEVTNRLFIHPMSAALVRPLARWGVRPNAVSVAGMVFGALAGLAYFHYEAWPYALAGFAFMVGWHVLDGADGQLARMTGQTSELGKILDGVCDHVAFAFVYVALAAAASAALGSWVWGMAVLAGVSHLVQASAYEFQRQSYDFWVHAKASARLDTPEEARRAVEGRRGLARAFGLFYVAYLRLQHRLAGVDAGLTAALSEALERADDSAERRAVRETYRAAHLDVVRRWALLSSNYRTLAIFVAALLGNPVYFFLFEILGLNAVFVGLRAMQAGRNRVLRTWLVGGRRPAAQPMLSNPV